MNHLAQKFIYLFVITALFSFSFHSPTSAAEVIKSFDSLIVVEKDGTFVVTETITVRAEGRKIRRGIFRDFPLYFEDAGGQRRQVGFELLSVKRDGQPDSYHKETRNDHLRIYIGHKDRFLPTGTYVYTLVYETTRQLRYFETHDEIYWNATGNFWDFPIENATAKIRAPEGSSFGDALAYTGRVGSTEQAVKVARIAGKTLAKYRSTRVLAPGEGMTVLAKLPKGAVDPPSDAQKAEWFWIDYKNLILGILMLLVVTTYYFISWWWVGRDPSGGAIVPRWSLPSEMSPAMVNYIYRKGLAGKGFDAISAAVLNLAVKGYVTLDKEEGGYFESGTLIITPTNKQPETSLPAGEASLFAKIRNAGGSGFKVASFNGKNVKKLQTGFANAMEREHRGKFYKHNLAWVIGGVALSVLALLMLVAFGSFSDDAIAAMFLAGFMTIFASVFVLSIAKSFMGGGGLKGKIMSLVLVSVFVFMFLSAGFRIFLPLLEIFSDVFLPGSSLLTIGTALIVLNVLFYFLLGAPTSLGRKRMDEIEGLKTYLTLAEKDRMNMADAPDFSTQHYEELLPYAVALDVEKPWSRAFETWLAVAVAAGAVASTYSPGWYRGSNFSAGRLSDTMGDFTNSMQSGFSSAMPVPKSSSSGFSGGGGSSGGGGGGGGGGGW
ncbi:MAG: DUF2207 domain-containing protein [Pseudomonadota bacterium]